MRHVLALMTAALAALAVSAVFLVPASARGEDSYEGGVEACDGKKVYLRPAEKRTLYLHNKVRAARELPRLCIQRQLLRAARQHSADMSRHYYISHDSRDGTTFAERVKREGYTSKDRDVYKIGENVAWGAGDRSSPRSMNKAWMKSDGHRKNLLKKDFRQVGIGVVKDEDESYGEFRMYTVDFGLRRR